MDMIEKVARALAAATFECSDDDVTSRHIDAAWPIYRDQAIAAIKAMREPTPEMIEAAWAEALAEDADGVWREMIEAALGNAHGQEQVSAETPSARS